MKRILALLVALAVSLGLTLVVATPASAVPTGCTSGWSAWYTPYAAPFWGQVRWCYATEYDYGYWQFQVQDIYTDGYAVHLEACSDWDQVYYPYTCHDVSGNFNPTWGHILTDYQPTGDTCIQSTGSISTSQFPAIVTWSINPHNYLYVRLVRGRCEGGAHQVINSVSFKMAGGP